MTALKGFLKFSTIKCVRCASARVLGASCPDCGKAPRPDEVNPPVADRRQLVKNIETELTRLNTLESAEPSGDYKDELVQIAVDYVSGLRELLSANPGADAITKFALVLKRGRDLAKTLEGKVAIRPSSLTRAYLGVSVELNQLWAVHKEALSSIDVLYAQRSADSAQLILDNATAGLNRWSATNESVTRLVGTEPNEPLMQRILRSLQVLHPELNFDALAEFGSSSAGAVLGKEVGAGAGVDFLVLETIGEAYFDPVAFNDKLKELASACWDTSRLNEVAAMENALGDVAVVRRDLFEVLNHFSQIANSEEHSGPILRRFVKVIGELYESANPLFVWFRLLTTTSSDSDQYVRLLKQDSTDLTRRLTSVLPLTFHDAPSYLRNMGHHGQAFEVNNATGNISIKLRSYSETFPFDEFVSRAFALLESVLAMNWTLGAALEQAAIDVPIQDEDAEIMGLSTPALLRFWISEHGGFEVTRSEVVGHKWYFQASIKEADVVSTALALASFPAKGWTSVVVVGEGPASRNLRVSLHDFSQHSKTVEDSDAKEILLSLLELRHQFTRDDECVLREEDLEFAVFVLGSSLLRGEVENVAPLRRVKRMAAQHGYLSISALIDKLISSLRTGADASLKSELGRLQTAEAPTLPIGTAVEVVLPNLTEAGGDLN